MLRTYFATAAGAIALASVLSAGPAFAVGNDNEHGSSTITYTLPGDDLFVEGVDTYGEDFYVTAIATGEVFRGQLGDLDSAEVFLPGGADGRTVAVGIEATDDLLIVAGGPTGKLFVYDRDSGELLAIHAVQGAGETYVNDIALTPSGDMYVTDSARDVVYLIETNDITDGSPLQVFTSFLGVDPAGQFNANGIVAASEQYLIVVQTDSGALYRVSTRDGSISPIDIGNARVTGGDGLEMKGRTLYVVRNAAEIITEVKLSGNVTRGQVASETTDPTFQFPTTAALHDGQLLIVNSQLDLLGGDPVEPFTLSDIMAP